MVGWGMSENDALQRSDARQSIGVLRPPSGYGSYGIGDRRQEIGNPTIGVAGEILAIGTVIKLDR